MTLRESSSDSSSLEPNKKQMKYARAGKNIFSISGHNGAALVEPVMQNLGWTKNQDKMSEDFRMKWTELVTQINYGKFREGEQLVNHIPNCGLITNKLGLLMSLRSYDRSIKDTKRPNAMDMLDFVPETYIIDDVKEREKFFSIYKEGEIWINKPTGLNQGKGISLIRDLDDFRKELDDRDNVSRSTLSGVKARIVQRYISNPLLVDGRKFDIRCYLFIASTTPYLVMYCPGYIRLSMNRYSNEDTDLITHLTNQFIQKKSPNYHEVKDDTVWSMTKFNDYINDKYSFLPKFRQNWAKNVLEKQMQQIILYVFQSVKNKLASRVGFFEIYGFDFMVDTDLKVWLIEVNVNPALHINCELLKEILPPMIEEVILLAIECFEKVTIHKKPLLPLDTQRLFTVLYWESITACRNRISAYSSLRTWVPPRYRSSSHSPNRSRNEETPTSMQVNSNGSQVNNRMNSSIVSTTGVGSSRTSSVTVGTQPPGSSRGFRFEQSLRTYAKVNINNNNNGNGGETIKASNNGNVNPMFSYHVRSKSFNPGTLDRSKQQQQHNNNNSNTNKSGDNTITKPIQESSTTSNNVVKQNFKKKPQSINENNNQLDRVSSSINFQSLTIDKSTLNTSNNNTTMSTTTTATTNEQKSTTSNQNQSNQMKKQPGQSVKATPAQREMAPMSLVQVVTGGGSGNKKSQSQASSNSNNDTASANTATQAQPTQATTSSTTHNSAQQQASSNNSKEPIKDKENIQQFIANSPYKPTGKVKLAQVSVRKRSKVYDRSS